MTRVCLLAKEDTSFSSRACRERKRLLRFEGLSAGNDWAKDVLAFYWSPCTTFHTKGKEHSLDYLQPTTMAVSGIRVPEINKAALSTALDLYIETVSHIALAFAIYNPILLIDLPLFKKFGDNGPFSGFFDEHQAQLMWSLFPWRFHKALRQIVKTDEEVLGIREWINELPDNV